MADINQIMMKTKLTNLLLLFSVNLIAQDTLSHRNNIIPVQAEAFAGNKRFALQTVVIKPFSFKSKFNFLSVVQTVNNYKNNTKDFDLVNVTHVDYNLYRGFGPSVGINTNNAIGSAPNVGLNYVYTHPAITFIINPDFVVTSGHNIEGISIIEYKPHIKNKFSFYTRMQAFYSYNIDEKFHERSFITARLGLTYGRFTFGAGANYDWYGPSKVLKENYGPYLMYLFL